MLVPNRDCEDYSVKRHSTGLSAREGRLVTDLIQSSDVNFKDEKYKAAPFGWTIHGW